MGKKDTPDIEIRGIEARFYDFFINIGSIGLYVGLIKRVINDMHIGSENRILDLGAGSGRNALLMRKYLNGGHITALEISPEMKKQFERKCSGLENVTLEDMRIESTLPFHEEFDKVFISFVIHGFEQQQRETILVNAYKALNTGGMLFIFDWNEMNLREQGPGMKAFFKYIECAPARDFITRDFRAVLQKIGFHDVSTRLYFKNRIRLLSGMK
jgi:ubiquinone/menaquinone biosynthesis C-methylase UbiE